MARFQDFKVGDDVRHSSRGHGVIRAIENGELHIEFDDYPGKISARFDRDWFRINPNLLSKDNV